MDEDGVHCTSDDFIPGMSFGLEGFVMDIDIGWKGGYISTDYKSCGTIRPIRLELDRR